MTKISKKKVNDKEGHSQTQWFLKESKRIMSGTCKESTVLHNMHSRAWNVVQMSRFLHIMYCSNRPMTHKEKKKKKKKKAPNF